MQSQEKRGWTGGLCETVKPVTQLYSYLLSIVCIGSGRPSLKDLHDHVVNNAAVKLRDFGVQLLRPDQEKMLDIIAADHPHDVVSCCKCVLKKWLDTTSDATWNELIRALRSPSVQLNYVAGQIEQMFITECELCGIMAT